MPNCGVTTVTKLMCTLYCIAYGWTGINNMPLGDKRKKQRVYTMNIGVKSCLLVLLVDLF